jgi:hypothetical protein
MRLTSNIKGYFHMDMAALVKHMNQLKFLANTAKGNWKKRHLKQRQQCIEVLLIKFNFLSQ